MGRGFLVALLLASTALAQTPPALDELEQAKVQIFRLQVALASALRDADVCRAEVGPLRAATLSRDLTEAERTLKAFIEGRHPGTTWNPKTGTFEGGR